MINEHWLFKNPNEFDIIGDGYTNTVVQTCITIISTMYSEPRFVEKLEGEPVENSLITELLDRPNQRESGATLRRKVAEDVCSYGNAYILIERNGIGRPLSLKRLDAQNVTVLRDTLNGEVLGYQYLGTKYLERDVIHLTWFITDPTNRYLGIAPIYGAMRAIQTYNEIQRHVAGTMARNGLTPMFALTKTPNVEGGLNKDAFAETFRKFWKRITGRTNNKNIYSNDDAPVIVLGEGEKLEPLGFDIKSLEAPELLKQTETQICSAFRVPPEIAITTAGLDNSTYNNLLVSTRNFITMTIKPLLVLHSEAINAKLMPLNSPNYIESNFNEISALEPTRNENITLFGNAFNSGVVTVDEYRSQLGLEPLNIPQLPTSEPLQLSKNVDNFYSIESMDYYTKALDVMLKLEVEFAKAHDKASTEVFKQIENELQLRFPNSDNVNAIDGVNALPVGYFEEQYQKAIESKLPTLAQQVIVWASNQAEFEGSQQDVEQLTNDFKDRVYTSSAISGNTIQTELKALAQTIPAGKLPDVIKQLRTQGTTLTDVNSATSSRTMATQLTNEVSERTWLKKDKQLRVNGKKIVKVWFTQRDSRVRPSHKAMEGTTVDVGKPFSYQEMKEVDGELVPVGEPLSLSYPADMPSEESVGAGVNCRCVMRPRIVNI